jgi:hypothetical protein
MRRYGGEAVAEIVDRNSAKLLVEKPNRESDSTQPDDRPKIPA